MYDDFYDLFDVSSDTSEETLEDAYREAVREYHPDVNDHDDATTQFKSIKKIYAVLSEDDKRADYDRLGHHDYVAIHFDGNVDGFEFAEPDESKDEASHSKTTKSSSSPSSSSSASSSSTSSTSGAQRKTAAQSTQQNTQSQSRAQTQQTPSQGSRKQRRARSRSRSQATPSSKREKVGQSNGGVYSLVQGSYVSPDSSDPPDTGTIPLIFTHQRSAALLTLATLTSLLAYAYSVFTALPRPVTGKLATVETLGVHLLEQFGSGVVNLQSVIHAPHSLTVAAVTDPSVILVLGVALGVGVGVQSLRTVVGLASHLIGLGLPAVLFGLAASGIYQPHPLLVASLGAMLPLLTLVFLVRSIGRTWRRTRRILSSS